MVARAAILLLLLALPAGAADQTCRVPAAAEAKFVATCMDLGIASLDRCATHLLRMGFQVQSHIKQSEEAAQANADFEAKFPRPE